MEFDYWQETELFSSSQHPNRLGVHPASNSTYNGGFFYEGKAART
jgi:hypothetical protein